MSEIVRQARALAIEMHDRFQHTRSNGEPYWRHPERVVATLTAAQLPPEVLAAAWLHDVPEDCAADPAECDALLADIERRFGPQVASITREVTNFFGPEATMEEKQARLVEHAAHMSAHAKWIKLADRRDNISGMDNWKPDKQQRYAAATVRLLAALQPLPPGAEKVAAEIAQRTQSILARA